MPTRLTRVPASVNLAALLALGFVLTASECRNDVIITDPVNNEICNNGIDDDGNGLTDCRDAACFATCTPALTVNPFASPVTSDTLTLSGTQQRAVTVTVSISPASSGLGGSAVLSGSNWSLQLHNLVNGTVTATAVGTDSTGALRDTVATTFDVAH
jgi:hypothetical protein